MLEVVAILKSVDCQERRWSQLGREKKHVRENKSCACADVRSFSVDAEIETMGRLLETLGLVHFDSSVEV